MIKKPVILSLSPLALALENKGKDLTTNAADWVHGLNTVSVGITPYTRNNVVELLPKATDAGSEHEFLQDQAATLMANAVKGSFAQIRTYLRPFSDELNNKLGSCVEINPEDRLYDRTTIRFFDLWHDFFDSNLMPTKTPISAYDYHAFPLKSLAHFGEAFPKLTEDQLKDKIPMSSIADVYQYVDDHDLYRVYNHIIRSPLELAYRFTGQERNMVSVLKVKPHYECWISLYLLTSRLITEETPLEGVTGINLSDYETYIHALHNLSVAALQQIRNKHAVLVPKKLLVEANPGSDPNGPVRKSDSVRVGVTDAGKAFVDTKEGTLSEAVIGYTFVWKDSKGSQGQPSLVDGWDDYIKRYKSECEKEVLRCTDELRNEIPKTINKVIQEFQKKNPEFKDFIMGLNNEAEFARLSTAMSEIVQKESETIIHRVVKGGLDLDEHLAKNRVTLALARLLKFNLAADILENAVTTGNKSVEERRVILGKAVAKSLVKLAFKQPE